MDVDKMLRMVLGSLKAERTLLERKIAAIEKILSVDGMRTREKEHDRRAMSSAARKAISRKMKTYWAKRKKATGKRAR